jgi:hypothetical protein
MNWLVNKKKANVPFWNHQSRRHPTLALSLFRHVSVEGWDQTCDLLKKKEGVSKWFLKERRERVKKKKPKLLIKINKSRSVCRTLTGRI